MDNMNAIWPLKVKTRYGETSRETLESSRLSVIFASVVLYGIREVTFPDGKNK